MLLEYRVTLSNSVKLPSVDGLEGEAGFLSSALTHVEVDVPTEHLVSVVL